MAKPRLVVDFDGVVVDALEECALVTWLGVHPPVASAPVSAHLPAIPPGFLRRFARVRDFSRTLDHFLVAHRAAADRVSAQAEFDRIYSALAPTTVRSFVAGASAARKRCRVEEAPFWLDLHTLYPGVAGLLERHAGAVAVITAKDAESVWTILRRRRLDHTVVEVIGECGRKDEALRDLAARHGSRPQEMTFVDDNLTNVRRVAATGARHAWATWGYHTPEDLATAARLGTPRLSLAEVPALAV